MNTVVVKQEVRGTLYKSHLKDIGTYLLYKDRIETLVPEGERKMMSSFIEAFESYPTYQKALKYISIFGVNLLKYDYLRAPDWNLLDMIDHRLSVYERRAHNREVLKTVVKKKDYSRKELKSILKEAFGKDMDLSVLGDLCTYMIYRHPTTKVERVKINKWSTDLAFFHKMNTFLPGENPLHDLEYRLELSYRSLHAGVGRKDIHENVSFSPKASK